MRNQHRARQIDALLRRRRRVRGAAEPFTGTIDEFLGPSDGAFGIYSSSANTKMAQIFYNEFECVLTEAEFELSATGAPVVGTTICELWALDAGTPGTDAEPTGARLAVSDARLNPSFSTGARQFEAFTFSGLEQYTLEADTWYAISLYNDDTTPVQMGYDLGGVHPGNYATYQPGGGVWVAASNLDVLFVATAGEEAPTEDIPGWDAGAKAASVVITGANDQVATLDTPIGDYTDNVHGATARSAGLRCFAVELTSAVGDCGCGLKPSATAVLIWPGQSTGGWGIWKSGNKYFIGSGAPSGTGTFSTGGIMMVAVNFTTGKIWFGKNGVWQGDPAADTGEAYSSVAGTLVPAFAAVVDGDAGTYLGGSLSYPYTPPTGFTPWEG